ncbi:MAG: hypothetical protein DBY30_02330 [Verrucomicrobia bacterium]|nr:MAG: hypothetical protein DBY30_02330 [Verrucomicrobiota bacterium]
MGRSFRLSENFPRPANIKRFRSAWRGCGRHRRARGRGAEIFCPAPDFPAFRRAAARLRNLPLRPTTKTAPKRANLLYYFFARIPIAGFDFL